MGRSGEGKAGGVPLDDVMGLYKEERSTDEKREALA
jgi:hypothetical protein